MVSCFHFLGGGYSYLHETFGKKYKYGNIPAFLSSWISTFAIGPGSIAAMGISTAEYTSKALFGECGVSKSFKTCLAALVISLLSL